jgi:triphosphoribosyl-dephospho-CoA synthase
MPVDIATAAQLACLLEASAPKPGNVSPGRHFTDTRYEDFLASAAALGPAFTNVSAQRVGQTILSAARSTSQWTRSNTNLGIVLLLAPIAHAAAAGGQLRESLRAVLEATTVDDARDVYAAIRLASPGGLGNAADQDVHDQPTVTLLAAMQLAAAHDGIGERAPRDAARLVPDGRAFGRQVDRRADHPGNAGQRLLDTAHARGAGHAGDRQVERGLRVSTTRRLRLILHLGFLGPT